MFILTGKVKRGGRGILISFIAEIMTLNYYSMHLDF
jgi:hypothetical protein